MSRFDDLLLKAKTVANAAGKKTGELVEVSKLKLEAVQINSDIQKAYERLGSVVYEQEKTGADNNDLIALCVSEIDGLLVELSDLNAKINEAKNTVKCMSCGAENPEGSLYCARCGSALNQVEYTSPVTVQAPVEEAAKEPASPAEATEEELSGTQEDNQ